MRYIYCAALLLVLCVPFAMAQKQKGTTTLKDVQPAGTTDKKNQNQQFDFSFDANGMSYVCRTSHKTKVKATDFVVGTNLTYQVDEHKGKLKNASGEEVKCTVVRVEKLPATPTAPAARN
jgi:FPC/CPF motif-containing protein YcgG